MDIATRRRPIAASLACMWLLGSGCRTETTHVELFPEPDPCLASLSVSGDTLPVLAWSPPCPVSGLEVRSGQRLVWRVARSTAEDTRLAPPVTYGVAPPTITVTHAAEELVPEGYYSVWIGRPAGLFNAEDTVAIAYFTYRPDG